MCVCVLRERGGGGGGVRDREREHLQEIENIHAYVRVGEEKRGEGGRKGHANRQTEIFISLTWVLFLLLLLSNQEG